MLLLNDSNVTETLLSKRLGRSRTDIAHTVRLLDLPDQAIELIDAGVLTKGHGKALLTEPDHARRRILARRAADQGWSVRTLEAEFDAAPARRASGGPHPDHAVSGRKIAGRDQHSDRNRHSRTATPLRVPVASRSVRRGPTRQAPQGLDEVTR